MKLANNWLRKKKKKRTPKRRYVYLFERISNRRWSTIFTFRKEAKIGIAGDVEERLKTVDAGIKGKVVLLEKYLIDAASTVEAQLHAKYKDSNFTVKGAKRNAGATEFHQLTNQQLEEIKKHLEEKEGRRDWFAILLNIIFWGCIVFVIVLKSL